MRRELLALGALVLLAAAIGVVVTDAGPLLAHDGTAPTVTDSEHLTATSTGVPVASHTATATTSAAENTATGGEPTATVAGPTATDERDARAGQSEGGESTPAGESEGPVATGAAESGATGTETQAAQPFALTVDDIEECGRTCRDVTSTLTNQQARRAADVTVATRIYAGNATGGDVVWSGTEAVGDLAAGESYTTTRRVDLSLGDAFAINDADGWVTIETTVQTADRTVTFSERRRVA